MSEAYSRPQEAEFTIPAQHTERPVDVEPFISREPLYPQDTYLNALTDSQAEVIQAQPVQEAAAETLNQRQMEKFIADVTAYLANVREQELSSRF